MSFMNFELLATDGKARRGRLTFRGVVETRPSCRWAPTAR